MGDFRKLDVWKRARELASHIYEATRQFPEDERFGLRTQLRRASVSIMANIAEGCGRNRRNELLRFLGIAISSATELESHLIVATDQNYFDLDSASALANEIMRVQRMLAGLIRHLHNQ